MNGPLLDFRNLTVSIPVARGSLHAVRGIDLTLEAGRTLCLVGESGCGKSLTALAIMGLLPAHARQTVDRFVLAGTDYAGRDPKSWARLRGREVAMIFQDPGTSLNPTLTVGRQMTEGAMHVERIGRGEADRRAADLLDRVGIANGSARLGQYPHEFSGGQRQRIMIATALMGNPSLLIADEPTTALDVTIQAQILSLLGELQRDLGLGLLLITHDLGVVAAIATDVAVMYAGRIAERGSVGAIFERPAHPYTRGLLSAIPVPGRTRRGSELPAIPGRVPELVGGIEGCAFRERCDRATADCAVSLVPTVCREGCHEAECRHPLDAVR